MADAELLLTIDGTDVTESIWSWASVQYTDAWDQHPSLSFTLRQAYGSVGTFAAYDDVRLVNLITGVVLFEGIIQPGELVQSERDPGWVESSIRCVGYQQLFDTSRVAQDFEWTGAADYASCPDTTDVLALVIAAAHGDARVLTTPVLYEYTPLGYTDLWVDAAGSTPVTIDEVTTTLSSAISTVLGRSLSETAAQRAAGFGVQTHPYIAKLVPGTGLALATPDTAIRGSAPVTLTAASYGRPSVATQLVDSGDIASHGYYTVGTAQTIVDKSSYGDTNGHVVWAPDRTYPEPPYGQSSSFYWLAGPGRSRTTYRIVSPIMPHDVLVGHELTFDTPWLGSTTGVVQSVQTTFADGVFDTDAAAWPYFLDGSKTLDGLWDLDDTSSRSIPRRMRRTSIVLADSNTAPASPKRMVAKLRAGTF